APFGDKRLDGQRFPYQAANFRKASARCEYLFFTSRPDSANVNLAPFGMKIGSKPNPLEPSACDAILPGTVPVNIFVRKPGPDICSEAYLAISSKLND